MTGSRDRGVDIDPLWDFQDPAASAERFLDLRAEVQTQLARSLGLQRKFAEADALLDEAERSASTTRTKTRVLLERGRVRNSSGDKAAAKPLFEKALEIADDEALRIDALHMLGIVDGPTWTEKALAMAEASDDPKARRWRASLLNNLGWSKHDAGDASSALVLFQRALDLREIEGTPFQRNVARWAVARCLRSLGRYAEALAIQEELAKNDPPDKYVDEELAELRKAPGQAIT
jgi:tetratricopeptide (TPR) repeat protein